MISVSVSATASYEVKIGSGLLPFSGEIIRNATTGDKVAVIAGENVFPLYAEIVIKSLQDQGLQPVPYVVPSGERAKTLDEYKKLLLFLSENHFSRTDTAVALGGGVTGDLVGFAAATYQRGMGFVQLPTTLLAAVDSSVGGKTAVNLPTGKNQVGSFYQPVAVVCDTDVLDTLPEREYCSGYAEVIKYAILFDEDLFQLLAQKIDRDQRETVIARCVQWKADVVKMDEFDTGKRRLLNLGHTIGHAAEVESNGRLLHGEAVSIGMAAITRAAFTKGFCDEETYTQILTMLKHYHLPTESDISADALYRRLLLDKKIAAGKLNLIVPTSIGNCIIIPIPISEAMDWLHAGGIE